MAKSQAIKKMSGSVWLQYDSVFQRVAISQYADSFVCALVASRIVAAEFGKTEILPRDLLLGLFRDWPDASFGESVGRQLGIAEPVIDKLAAQLGGLKQVKPAELYGDLPLAADTQSIVNQAIRISSERGSATAATPFTSFDMASFDLLTKCANNGRNFFGPY